MNCKGNQSFSNRNRKNVTLALLGAVVVILQVLCTFVKFGPFSITLALAPIIIGAAVCGLIGGVLLGTLFGLVVLLTGILGWDGGLVMTLMGINPLATIAICLVKGAMAGLVSGLIYRLFHRKSDHVGVLFSAVLCPVMNTGLFVLGMSLFFMPMLQSWADGSGKSLVYYIIFILAGGNFLVELLSNLVLSTGITRIIRVSKK